jgi:hypothetical protein
VRVFFSGIHYLALVGERGALSRRLRARSAWREWDEPRIEEMLKFNDWLRANAATRPPVCLFETTHAAVEAAVAEAWVQDLFTNLSEASGDGSPENPATGTARPGLR